MHNAIALTVAALIAVAIIVIGSGWIAANSPMRPKGGCYDGKANFSA